LAHKLLQSKFYLNFLRLFCIKFLVDFKLPNICLYLSPKLASFQAWTFVISTFTIRAFHARIFFFTSNYQKGVRGNYMGKIINLVFTMRIISQQIKENRYSIYLFKNRIKLINNIMQEFFIKFSFLWFEFEKFLIQLKETKKF
jgi:hypothetical protein